MPGSSFQGSSREDLLHMRDDFDTAIFSLEGQRSALEAQRSELVARQRVVEATLQDDYQTRAAIDRQLQELTGRPPPSYDVWPGDGQPPGRGQGPGGSNAGYSSGPASDYGRLSRAATGSSGTSASRAAAQPRSAVPRSVASGYLQDDSSPRSASSATRSTLPRSGQQLLDSGYPPGNSAVQDGSRNGKSSSAAAMAAMLTADTDDADDVGSESVAVAGLHSASSEARSRSAPPRSSYSLPSSGHPPPSNTSMQDRSPNGSGKPVSEIAAMLGEDSDERFAFSMHDVEPVSMPPRSKPSLPASTRGLLAQGVGAGTGASTASRSMRAG